MVATVTLVVAGIGIVAPHVPRLAVFVADSAPDLAALFAVGILAAGIVRASEARRSWNWPAMALIALVPVGATIWLAGTVWTLDHLLWVDLLLGPAIGCLLAGIAVGRPATIVRVLDAKPLRTLGLSSYSLYLTHGPIVVVVYELIVARIVGHGASAFLLAVALTLPLAVLFAHGFASAFERPTRTGAALRLAAVRRVATAAAVSLAHPRNRAESA